MYEVGLKMSDVGLNNWCLASKLILLQKCQILYFCCKNVINSAILSRRIHLWTPFLYYVLRPSLKSWHHTNFQEGVHAFLSPLCTPLECAGIVLIGWRNYSVNSVHSNLRELGPTSGGLTSWAERRGEHFWDGDISKLVEPKSGMKIFSKMKTNKIHTTHMKKGVFLWHFCDQLTK